MVPGEGPQPCLGMIVGEAPGREEVSAGRPFVGRSGRLLETALRSLGVAREEVYITNVVKDLPLDSEDKIRRPYPEEVEDWRTFLEREIANTAPAAVLALGETAAHALTGLKGTIPWGSRIGNVYVAWHPAYVLRRGIRSMVWGQTRYDEWLDQLEGWAEAIRA